MREKQPSEAMQLDMASMMDGVAREVDQSTPDRQETINKLIDFFGDQEFEYGSHKGTIATIVSVCPAAESFVAQGFDAMVEWVSPFKVETTNEETSKEENKNTEVSNKDVSDIDKTVKTPVDQIDQNIATQTSEASTSPAASREESIRQAISHAKQVAEDSAESAIITLPQVAATKIIEQSKVDATVESSEAETSSLPTTIIDRATTHSNTPDIVAETSAEVVVEKVSKTEQEQSVNDRDTEVDVEIKKSVSIRHIEDALLPENLTVNNNAADPDLIVEKTHIPVELASGETGESTVPTETELSVMVDSKVEIAITPDVVETMVQENDPTPLPVRNEIIEVTIADVEVAGNNDEVLFTIEEMGIMKIDSDFEYIDVTAVNQFQQLDKKQDVAERQVANESMDVQEVLGRTSPDDTSVEMVSAYVNDEEVIIETHEKVYVEEDLIINEIANMVGEQSTEELTADAKYIAIEQAQKIEQSIVLLGHAKTGQECADHLQEIREELAGLLHVLGYKNVDMLVERLLKIYDVKTLRQFMVNLIIANSQAQYTVQQATTTVSYYKLGRQVVALLIHSQQKVVA